jgi:hypothetical protein
VDQIIANAIFPDITKISFNEKSVTTCFRSGGDRGKTFAAPVQLVDCIVFVWFVGRKELLATQRS